MRLLMSHKLEVHDSNVKILALFDKCFNPTYFETTFC